LQRGFWGRAGARRSQGKALAQDLRNGHLVTRTLILVQALFHRERAEGHTARCIHMLRASVSSMGSRYTNLMYGQWLRSCRLNPAQEGKDHVEETHFCVPHSLCAHATAWLWPGSQSSP